jgi:hypothetical protein
MLVKYNPEDKPAEAREWDFDPNRVRRARGEMIERRYGKRYSVWVAEIQAGEMAARAVLLWHLMNLDSPTFRWEDTPDFAFGELELDYSITDLQKLRREVDESAMDDESKEETLKRLDLEIANRVGKDIEELTPEDMGKAEAPSGTSTSAT